MSEIYGQSEREIETDDNEDDMWSWEWEWLSMVGASVHDDEKAT